ncbi:MAG TPA: iron-containing redox enzyme family protein [Candidatus Angelobacter sp.]|jgi:pyrroloquinoline quinone (PQQ) biosynthesis protein C|nr:iron-containing redox enzyme family protein [Candidatus Angelobacter sp.]
MTASLETLLANITNHPALNNDFYHQWMTRKFTIDELAVFARNYGEWVKSFPDALAILLVTTDDIDAKTEYVKTLFSEMGYGNAEKVHCILLDNFFKELAKQMGHEGEIDWNRLQKTVELAPTTRQLIEGEQELYRDRQLSFGAQLALEWQAYTMLRKLYDGARNYLPLWSNADEFHEACEYYYAHIGATEKEHKEESLKAVKRYATSEQSLAKIVDGYHRHLELIFNFWQGLFHALTTVGERSTAAA